MPQIHDETVVEEIAEEVVEHDRDLVDDVRATTRRAADAKARSGEAIATLNQWRWEMTACPLGPCYRQEAYARAVGQNQSTISRGARAWQAHLDASESMRDASVCSLGTETHDFRDVPPPLTDDEVLSHGAAQRRLSVSEAKALLIERLAVHFGVVPTTMQINYRSLTTEAERRLLASHDVESMPPADVAAAADDLAREMRAEFVLRQSRERAVGRWMQQNRLAERPTLIADVRRMMARIERRMESREWTWGEAETDAREWDFRRCEAQRKTNELDRRARLAVLELREAAASMEAAAMRLGRAMQTIEQDEIPIEPDELTLVEESLSRSAMLVGQARAAVGGSSGTDWDAAFASLGSES